MVPALFVQTPSLLWSSLVTSAPRNTLEKNVVISSLTQVTIEDSLYLTKLTIT